MARERLSAYLHRTVALPVMMAIVTAIHCGLRADGISYAGSFYGSSDLPSFERQHQAVSLCDKVLPLPHSAQEVPSEPGAIPPVIYGPYRGPNPRIAEPSLLRRTTCLLPRRGGIKWT